CHNPDSNQQHTADGVAECANGFWLPNQRRDDPAEENGQQNANNQSAKHPDVLEHFAEAQPFLGRFRLWEMLSKEHDAITNRWYQEQGELNLPVPLQFVVQYPT